MAQILGKAASFSVSVRGGYDAVQASCAVIERVRQAGRGRTAASAGFVDVQVASSLNPARCVPGSWMQSVLG